MIARATRTGRNRRNLPKNPGLLAKSIQPVTGTVGAALSDEAIVNFPSNASFGTYVISPRPEDYIGWTNQGASPIGVRIPGTGNHVALKYAVTPVATDHLIIPEGATAVRTKLGGQISAQTLVLS